MVVSPAIRSYITIVWSHLHSHRPFEINISLLFNSKCDLERIVIYYVINNFLLTEREVFTDKYRTEVFFVQTEPLGRGLYKKTEVRYFSVKTKQARLIKSLLYGI